MQSESHVDEAKVHRKSAFKQDQSDFFFIVYILNFNRKKNFKGKEKEGDVHDGLWFFICWGTGARDHVCQNQIKLQKKGTT